MILRKLKCAVILNTILALTAAHAADLNWSGLYRAEANYVDNINIDSGSSTYLNHHLILRPKIIAADGFNIYSRFDVMNNSSIDTTNQLGSFLGSGPSSPDQDPNTENDNNLSYNQNSDLLQVNELYLVWAQEFGSLIVGRMPKHFGMGMSHNAGQDSFDHWMSNQEGIGYKMIFGNMYLLPVYAKINEGDAKGDSDDVNEYNITFMYANPDTKLEIGVMYETRKSSTAVGNDGDNSTVIAEDLDETKNWGSFDRKAWNLFVSKSVASLDFAIEASFIEGDTGMLTTDDTEVVWDAFGIASKFDYKVNEKWDLHLKAGSASGDNPETPTKIEAFLFHKNYDVAKLLFNYAFGDDTKNLLRTNLAGRNSNLGVDSETLSNVIYIAPAVSYSFNSAWKLKTTVIYAQLNEAAFSDASTDLGYELDMALDYRAFDRFHLSLEAAYLMPGKAFDEIPGQDDAEDILGFFAKAAIQF